MLDYWEKFIEGGILDNQVNELIAKGWELSKYYKVDTNGGTPIPEYSKEELPEILRKNDYIIDIMGSHINLLLNTLTEEVDIVINYLDKECYIIKQWHKNDFHERLKDLGLYPGRCCELKYLGTNGGGAAHYFNQSIIIEGYEHYIKKYHSILEMAAPIHDFAGNIIGIVNIVMPQEQYMLSIYRALLVMVHGIERELKISQHVIEQVNHKTHRSDQGKEPLISKNKFNRLIDISKNKQLLLESIFNQPFIGIIYYDYPTGRVINVNKKYLAITKEVFKTSHIIGLRFDEYIKEEWVDQSNQDYRDTTAFWKERNTTGLKGNIKEICIPREGKNYYYNIDVQPVKREGKIMGWLETIADVTTIGNAKLELEEREQFITEIFNSFNLPVNVISYPDMKYKYINKEGILLMGNFVGEDLTKEAIQGKTIWQLLPSTLAKGYSDVLKKTIEKGKPLQLRSKEIQLPDGSKVIHKVTNTPLCNMEGRIQSIVSVGMDITEEVEFARSKDEFLAIISHELRSPTNIILAVVQLLLTDKYKRELTPKAAEHIQSIKQNAYRLLRLINNILDIQRTQAGYLDLFFENVDIVSISEELTHSIVELAESKKIQVIFDTDLEEQVIATDIQKYERILLNVLSNAVKFTQEGGEVFVTVSLVEDYVRVSVKDNGIGISEDKLERIFDKFIMIDSSLSRRSEGTGLGLSLVKMMVEKLDGRIEIISRIKEGTEFIIELPSRQINKTGEIVKSLEEIEHIANIEFADLI